MEAKPSLLDLPKVGLNRIGSHLFEGTEDCIEEVCSNRSIRISQENAPIYEDYYTPTDDEAATYGQMERTLSEVRSQFLEAVNLDPDDNLNQYTAHLDVRYVDNIQSLKDKIKSCISCNEAQCPIIKERIEHHILKHHTNSEQRNKQDKNEKTSRDFGTSTKGQSSDISNENSNRNEKYKEKLNKEILEWSKEVPSYPNQSDENIKQNLINEFISQVIGQSNHVNDSNYAFTIKMKAENLLHSLPTHTELEKYDGVAKEDLTENLVDVIHNVNQQIYKQRKRSISFSTDTDGLNEILKITSECFNSDNNNINDESKSNSNNKMIGTSNSDIKVNKNKKGNMDARLQVQLSMTNIVPSNINKFNFQKSPPNTPTVEYNYILKQQIGEWIQNAMEKIDKNYVYNEGEQNYLVKIVWSYLKPILNYYMSDICTDLALEKEIFNIINNFLFVDVSKYNKVFKNYIAEKLFKRFREIKSKSKRSTNRYPSNQECDESHSTQYSKIAKEIKHIVLDCLQHYRPHIHQNVLCNDIINILSNDSNPLELVKDKLIYLFERSSDLSIVEIIELTDALVELSRHTRYNNYSGINCEINKKFDDNKIDHSGFNEILAVFQSEQRILIPTDHVSTSSDNQNDKSISKDLNKVETNDGVYLKEINDWLNTLPRKFNTSEELKFKDIITKCLTREITEQDKFDHGLPKTDAEDEKHKRFIIQKWLKRFEIFKASNDAKPFIGTLVKKLKNITKNTNQENLHRKNKTIQKNISNINQEISNSNNKVPRTNTSKAKRKSLDSNKKLQNAFHSKKSQEQIDLINKKTQKNVPSLKRKPSAPTNIKINNNIPNIGQETLNSINKVIQKNIDQLNQETLYSSNSREHSSNQNKNHKDSRLNEMVEKKIPRINQKTLDSINKAIQKNMQKINEVTLDSNSSKNQYVPKINQETIDSINRTIQKNTHKETLDTNNKIGQMTIPNLNTNDRNPVYDIDIPQNIDTKFTCCTSNSIQSVEPDKIMKQIILKHIRCNCSDNRTRTRNSLGYLLKSELPNISDKSIDKETLKNLEEELHYIFILSEWLKENSIKYEINKQHVYLVNALANDIQVGKYDINNRVTEFVKQLVILPEKEAERKIMIEGLTQKLQKDKSKSGHLTRYLVNNNLSDFVQDFISNHVNDLNQNEFILDACSLRFVKDMNACIDSNTQNTNIMCRDNTVRRFSDELNYAKEISDWLKTLPLQSVTNKIDADSRVIKVNKLIEEINKYLTNPNDTSLREYINQWISMFPIDAHKEFDTFTAAAHLVNKIKRSNAQQEQPQTMTNMQNFTTVINCSTPCCDFNQNSEKKANRNPAEAIVDVIDQWCNDLPLDRNVEQTEDLKGKLATKLYRKIGDINIDPIYFNDDTRHHEALTYEITNELQKIPTTPLDPTEKENLVDQLVRAVMENRKIIKDNSLGEQYKQNLENTITISMPNSLSVSKGTDPGFEIYKDRLARVFILENFDHGQNPIKLKYERKMHDEIDIFFPFSQDKNEVRFTNEQFYNAVYSTLFHVSQPGEKSIAEVVEKIKTKCEIDMWYDKLPLKEAKDSYELLERDKILSVFANRINDIENNEINSEEKIDNEIKNLLSKQSLLPGKEGNVDKLANDLKKRLKLTTETRKRVYKNGINHSLSDKEINANSHSNKEYPGPSYESDTQTLLPTCCKIPVLNKGPVDVILDIVENWCNNLPIPAKTVNEVESVKLLKNRMVLRLIIRISELNTNPAIFNDDILYKDILDDELENIVFSSLPSCCDYVQNKEHLKCELKDEILSIKPMILEENIRYKYKQDLKNVIDNILDKPNNTNQNKALLNEVENKIIDNYIIYYYHKDDVDGKVNYKMLVMNAVTKYFTTCGTPCCKFPDPLIKSNQLICELNKIPPPEGEVVMEEVEEIRMKFEIGEFFNELQIKEENIPPKLQLKSTLTRRLSDLEKSGHNDSIDIKIKEEIKKSLDKINETVNDDKIESFIKRLKDTEKLRKSHPPQLFKSYTQNSINKTVTFSTPTPYRTDPSCSFSQNSSTEWLSLLSVTPQCSTQCNQKRNGDRLDINNNTVSTGLNPTYDEEIPATSTPLKNDQRNKMTTRGNQNGNNFTKPFVVHDMDEASESEKSRGCWSDYCASGSQLPTDMPRQLYPNEDNNQSMQNSGINEKHQCPFYNAGNINQYTIKSFDRPQAHHCSTRNLSKSSLKRPFNNSANGNDKIKLGSSQDGPIYKPCRRPSITIIGSKITGSELSCVARQRRKYDRQLEMGNASNCCIRPERDTSPKKCKICNKPHYNTHVAPMCRYPGFYYC